jgi:hypothetical protein
MAVHYESTDQGGDFLNGHILELHSRLCILKTAGNLGPMRDGNNG